MVKKLAILLLLIISIQLISLIPVAASSTFGEVAAVSALLVERDNGIILHEKDIFIHHPADSLTKVMTLLLATEAVELQRIIETEVIEMTDTAWEYLSESSATQSILSGQKMTYKDLMYSAIIGNASEACYMLALRLAGNVDAFVRMMNDKASELGCNDTNFVNPDGAYHPDQYTTAYDMYLIYNEALKNDLFSEIAGTYRHTTEQNSETESRTLISSNSLLNINGVYYYRYCQSGIGTGVGGNSYEGGYSLVSSAEEDGLTLISVVLGAGEIMNADQSVTLLHYFETNRLFLWGYENFGWRDILKTTDLLARVPVLHGNGADFVNVRPDRSFSMLLETSVPTSEFKLDMTIFSEVNDTPLVAPISAGDVLGEVVVTRNGEIYDTIALVANTNIDISPAEIAKRGVLSILDISWVRWLIFALIVIIFIYTVLVIRYNIIRRRRLRKIRAAKNELIREKQENVNDDFF